MPQPRRSWRRLALLLPLLLAVACATPERAPEARMLKRRIAVLRFDNTTDFATGAFDGSYGVPLEEQAVALIEQQLQASDQILLVDAWDFTGDESELAALKADYVLVGTLSEFGRSTQTKTRFYGRTKRQGATATIQLRLIETRTSQDIFVGAGQAQVAVETWRLFGMGPDAPFNTELNGRALAGALSEPVDLLLARIQDRPWRTVVVATEGRQIMIAGGDELGLRIGDVLSVRKRGRRIVNPQIEGQLELPSEEVAQLKVISFFGHGTNRQGTACRLIDGLLGGHELDELIVEELR